MKTINDFDRWNVATFIQRYNGVKDFESYYVSGDVKDSNKHFQTMCEWLSLDGDDYGSITDKQLDDAVKFLSNNLIKEVDSNEM